MELYQLRSLVAVAELGHLTRAAERLHISQPALSAQIKALEDELGLVLFTRTPSGMTLTAAGKRLVAEADKVLAAAQALNNEAKALKGSVTGKVSVGTIADPELIRVGELLNATVERYPRLEVELHQEISGAALEKVHDKTLDASFYFGEMTSPGVAGLSLRKIAYRVVGPAAWRARMEGADWGEIAALPWILTPSISTHNQLLRAFFMEHGVEPARVVEADQESVISSLVVSGVGVSTLREEIAVEKEAAGELTIWSDTRLETTLRFIYAQERSDDPVIRALLDVLRDIWGLAEKPAAKPQASGGRLAN